MDLCIDSMVQPCRCEGLADSHSRSRWFACLHLKVSNHVLWIRTIQIELNALKVKDNFWLFTNK